MKRLGLAVLVVGALAFLTCTAAQSQATPSIATQPREGITLREYVDVRFAAQQAAVDAALASADRANSKAEAASDKRFDAVNEFRASLNDNTRTLMPRAEAEQAFKAINDKLDTLTARVNAREDRSAGAGNLWGILVGGIGAVVGIGGILGWLFGRAQTKAGRAR